MSLSAEQLKKIEENRREALKKKAAAEALRSSPNIAVSIPASKSSDSNVTSKSFYGESSSTGNTTYVKKPLDIATAKANNSNGTTNRSFPSSGPNAKKFKNNFNNNSSSSSSNPFGPKETKVMTGICKVTSPERFSVVAGYHQPMIDLFKTIPSRLYDMNRRTWSFHLDDHDLLMKELKNLGASVSVTGIPKLIRELFKQKGDHEEVIDMSRIDEKLMGALMPFQVEGVRFCIAKNGRAMIADDMGLGKTLQALAVAHYYKEDWPLLIACPSSVRFAWSEGCKTWLPSVPHHQVVVMMTSKDFVEDARVLIVSYDLLTKQGAVLKKMNFKMIILDESHSLKNFKTQRSKAAQPFAKAARRVLLLSGTPALSRPVELYCQLSFINPAKLISFHEFGLRYCGGVQRPWGWDFAGSSNMDELTLLLQECFMIRRLKTEVLKQLPAKFRQVVVLPPGSVDMKLSELRQAQQSMQRSNLRGAEKQGALLAYFHATSFAKLRGICDYVMDMVKDDKKFLCFAHHKAVLDAICDKLDSSKYNYIRIDGTTDPRQRQENCQKFQDDDRVRVAVLSITAANAGITLTAAHFVLFAELFWNPGVLLQAEDRAHRIGQMDSVVVQYLIAQGTADDHLWLLLQQKLSVLNLAGLNVDNLTATASAATKRLQDRNQPSITDFLQTDGDEDDELLASLDLDAFV